MCFKLPVLLLSFSLGLGGGQEFEKNLSHLKRPCCLGDSYNTWPCLLRWLPIHGPREALNRIINGCPEVENVSLVISVLQ